MFTGFTPETLDFLWGIRMNNNREWFLSHKKQYTDTLYEPMKALGRELFEPFQEMPGYILKVGRIYRDARMHPPTPYKESLWLSVRRDGESWAESGCLYFDISPEGVQYGFGLYAPKAATMEAFRREISVHPEAFLSTVAKVEAAARAPITAETYQKPRQAEDPRLAPYFAWKGKIHCVRDVAPGEAMFGPHIAQEAKQMFKALTPLYSFFNSL